jgi:phospholipid N-methyltransferase
MFKKNLFYNSNKNQKNYKKIIFFNFYFLMIVLFFIVMGFYQSINLYNSKTSFIYFHWYDYFSFSRYNIFFILLTILMILFFKNQNKKVLNILLFCILINTLFNVFTLRSFIRDWNIYPVQNHLSLNLVIYYGEYILIPILFVIFYYLNFNNDFCSSINNCKKYSIFNQNKKKSFILFLCSSIIFFCLYFYIKIFLHLFFQKNFKIGVFFQEQFINPYDKKKYFLSYFKIIISFLFLNFVFLKYIIISDKNKKNYFKKIFLLFLSILLVSFITYRKQDWLHAKQFLLKPKIMGTILLPETQEMSEYFQNVSNLTKDELNKKKDKILELGSGSGNITQYLVDKFGEENLISIEIIPELSREIKKKFPKITVIQGDASDFIQLIKKENIKIENIKGIVSTLPVGLFNDQTFEKLCLNIEQIVNSNNIKFMNYRFKWFETDNREMKKIKKTNSSNFIFGFIMPVMVYTYEKI